ncbi:MAG TPA: hypothetical protein VFA46_05050 [Actinomycetes bacterium]|nr:hypothetical protein [Actinomycetes bacterium]
MRLFRERARAVRPDFELREGELAAVAQIVRRLDGLPLAIELAAARVRTLPPTEIVVRLDDRFAVLTAGGRTAVSRQRTLRAAVDWSYDLLCEHERVLFGRLAVFAGGFGLDAVEEICAGAGVDRADMLDLLTRLVEQSLVVADLSTPPRFRMLETIREYAAERLTAYGQAEEFRRRHAAFFLALAERTEPERTHPAALARLGLEEDNLRAAIAWALKQPESDTALRFGGALVWFWFLRREEEGRRLLAAALAGADRSFTRERGRGLLAMALVDSLYPTKESLAAADEALHILETVGDRQGAALARTQVALGLALVGEFGRALAVLDEAEATLRDLGDVWAEAFAWLVRIVFELRHGSLDRADDLGRRCLERFRGLGDQWGVSGVLWHLGIAAGLRGDYAQAVGYCEETLALARDQGLPSLTCVALSELGHLHVLLGDEVRAALCHTDALTVAEELGSRGAIAAACNAMGASARRRGDPLRARGLHLRALDLYAGLAMSARLAATASLLGFAEEQLGNLEEAAMHHREAIGLARTAGHPSDIALSLEGLANVAAARGDAQRAARLLGAAAALRSQAGHSQPLAASRFDVGRAESAARVTLGDELFDALFEQGRAIDLAAALALAES